MKEIKSILSYQNILEISDSPTIMFGKEIGPRSNFKTSCLDQFSRHIYRNNNIDIYRNKACFINRIYAFRKNISTDLFKS